MVETFAGLLGGEAVIRLFTVTAGVVTVRTLAPPAFGAFTYATVIGETVGVALDLGLSIVVLRDASAHPADASRLLGAALTAILILAVPSVVVATALVTAGLIGDTASPVAVMLGVAAALAETLGRPCESVLLARGHARLIPAIRAMRGTALVLAVAAATLLRHPDAEAFLAASVIGSLAGSALAVTTCSRLGTAPDFAHAGRAAMRLLRRAVPFAMLAVSYLAFSQIDLVMLGLLAGRTATGQYGAALRILGMALLVPVFLGSAFLTTVSGPASRADDRGPADGVAPARQLGRAMRAALRIGAALAFATALAGPWAISIVAGSGYVPAGHLLARLSPVLFIVSAYAILTNLQVALDRTRSVALIRLAACGFKTAANLILIPRWGARGAAISTVASELVVLAAVVLVSRSQLRGTGLGRFAAHLGVAIVLMAAVAAALGPVAGLPWPGVLAGGLLTFGLLQARPRLPARHDDVTRAPVHTRR